MCEVLSFFLGWWNQFQIAIIEKQINLTSMAESNQTDRESELLAWLYEVTNDATGHKYFLQNVCNCAVDLKVLTVPFVDRV